MALREKLEKFKRLSDQESDSDWTLYKEAWKNAVSELQATIQYKWFEEYFENRLMQFASTPVKRFEPYIGEYLTTSLEITLPNNKFLILEPVSAVTAEYDGRLDLYMLGSQHKKAIILRQIIDDSLYQWFIIASNESKVYHKLDKQQLEKLIDEWLQ